MYMKAKITDVAQKANVSISTVSHVLNHTRFVSEETRKKSHGCSRRIGVFTRCVWQDFFAGKKNDDRTCCTGYYKLCFLLHLLKM